MLKPMSISEIAKKTGRTPHMVRTVVLRLKCVPTHSVPIGKYPRQYYQPEPILEAVKLLKPSITYGPNKRY